MRLQFTPVDSMVSVKPGRGFQGFNLPIDGLGDPSPLPGTKIPRGCIQGNNLASGSGPCGIAHDRDDIINGICVADGTRRHPR